MKVVWELERATVQDVQSSLARRRRRKLAYTTVMTMLKILTEKGFLRYETEGRAYVYSPTVSREHVERAMVGDLVDRLFDGAAARMALGLIEDSEIDADELQRLRKLIEQKEKESRDADA